MLGNQPKYRENTRIKIIARKKDGVETERSEKIIKKLSRNLFCLIAEIMPITMPMMAATMVPPTAKTRV
jgi:hypothetical protein